MKEYFIIANTFAAPFVSETIETFTKGKDAKDAMKNFIDGHKNEIYSARGYKNADAFYKKEKPVVNYDCNKLLLLNSLTKDKSTYSYLSHSDKEFELDDVIYKVEEPREGVIY